MYFVYFLYYENNFFSSKYLELVESFSSVYSDLVNANLFRELRNNVSVSL